MKYIFLLILTLTSVPLTFAQTLSPEEAERKIAGATHPALPQRPRVKTIRPDAEMERLKGKVRSVTSWTKEVGANSWQRGSVHEYDEDGYLLRSISYDHMGNPFMVRVYGYIDDKRVSKAGFIDHPYDPPAPPAPRETGVPAPRDYRYTNSYEFTYDPKGRLIERVMRANNGKVIERKRYVYETDQVKRVSVDPAEKEIIEGIDLFNAKGELVRTTRPAFSRYGESLYEYTYGSFDPMGNWLERTAVGKTGQWDGKQKASNWIEKREITYY